MDSSSATRKGQHERTWYFLLPVLPEACSLASRQLHPSGRQVSQLRCGLRQFGMLCPPQHVRFAASSKNQDRSRQTMAKTAQPTAAHPQLISAMLAQVIPTTTCSSPRTRLRGRVNVVPGTVLPGPLVAQATPESPAQLRHPYRYRRPIGTMIMGIPLTHPQGGQSRLSGLDVGWSFCAEINGHYHMVVRKASTRSVFCQ